MKTGTVIVTIMIDTKAWHSLELREIAPDDYRVYIVRHLNTWGIPKGSTELGRTKTLQDGLQMLAYKVESYDTK